VSELINITVIQQEDVISIGLIEQPPIKVNLYPVTVAHPSIINAANQAISSAETATVFAQQAADAAQEAIAALGSIPDTVETAVEESIATQLSALQLSSLINALIFG
jgi:hypothetical protein